jgi:hypothetical protein
MLDQQSLIDRFEVCLQVDKLKGQSSEQSLAHWIFDLQTENELFSITTRDRLYKLSLISKRQ